MGERETDTNWDCHRALVKSAVERERQILLRIMDEVAFSLGDINFFLKDTERWKNVETVIPEIQFEREYLIRISDRVLQFYSNSVKSISQSTDHLIRCMEDKFETDTESVDVVEQGDK